MNLSLLILLPLLTAVIILLVRSARVAKLVALAGATAQLGMSFFLLYAFQHERMEGNVMQMLFEQQHNWFPSWHISYHLGVDGISVR